MWNETCYCHVHVKGNMPSNSSYKPHVPISSCKHETPMSVYASYEPNEMKNVTRNIVIHFTLLTYITGQICLPHHTCMTQCTTTVVYIKIPHYCTKKSKTTPHIIVQYVQKTNMPLKCHIYTTHASYFMWRYETIMSLYIPHMNSLQLTAWSGALLHIHFTS